MSGKRSLHLVLALVVAFALLQGCSQLQDLVSPPDATPPPDDNPDNTWEGRWDPDPTAGFIEEICLAAMHEGEGTGPAVATGLSGGPSLDLAGFWFDTPEHSPSVSGEYPHGPGEWNNRYAPIRTYHPAACGSLISVAWQAHATGQIQLSLMTTDGSAYGTMALPTSGRQLMAADLSGRYLYYLTTVPDATDRSVDMDLRLHRFDLGAADRDRAHYSRQIDTSRAGLNAVAAGGIAHGHATLRHDGDRLALVLAHMMHESPDGLNHQRAVAAILDPQSLAIQSNLGQTSGHSFEHRLSLAGDGGFMLLDVGDNYPRGLHLHRFGAGRVERRVVYTYKTEHGRVPQSPAGVTYARYDEISTGSDVFYRWSNDNNSYTELGGAVEVDAGIAVLFAGEPAPDGRALDSSRVGRYLNDTRHIGFVLVRHDFQDADREVPTNWVPDELVLSEATHSVNDVGGFYTFGGDWQPQRNAGVRWLTDIADPSAQNVSRLRVAGLAHDTILVMWEAWTPYEYVETAYMLVSQRGEVVSGPHAITDGDFRIARADETVVLDGRAWFIDGNGDGLVISSAAPH